MTKPSTAIQVDNVSFGYGSIGRAVDDVSFQVAEKSTTMLIGPNGSGKTTLLKLMIGMLEPTQGNVTVLGTSPKHARSAIGYVPQKLTFDQTFPLTAHEFLALSYAGAAHDITDMLRDLDVQQFANVHVGTLSGGQLQRVLIARSLLGSPEILFLDEPASGIDIGGEHNFYDLIKDIQSQHNMTVVMVSHQIGLVSQFADQVVCINKKLLSVGKPEVKLTPKVIEKLFGEDVALHEHRH